MKTFVIKPTPSVRFGVNTINELPEITAAIGRKVLFVIGSASISSTEVWPTLLEEMTTRSISFEIAQVDREPTPEIVDGIVGRYKQENLEAVVSIGGGSVLDAGKAISAMLATEGSIQDYLEDVGVKKPNGEKIPFIAVPTTSGTGSEMTSNAVICRVGAKGFKKSLRHDAYIPNIAIVDPLLTMACPQNITRNCTMDAFTQLVESYLSTGASPYTDDLALGALSRIVKPLLRLTSAEPTLEDRIHLAYGANISGITLANAGLGVVHGFATVIGGEFVIPHGVVCGTLMASCNAKTLSKLRKISGSDLALAKYVKLGKLFTDRKEKSNSYYQDYFLDTLHRLTATFQLETLSKYNISNKDLYDIAEKTGSKYNPVQLSTDEKLEILESRLV